MINFFKNYLSTTFFIIISYLIYFDSVFYRNFLIKSVNIKFFDFNISTLSIYKWIVILYLVFLIPFYIYFKDNSKARIIFEHLYNKIKDFLEKTITGKIISILQFIFFILLIYIFVYYKINIFNELDKYVWTFLLLSILFFIYTFVKFIWYKIEKEEKVAILVWCVKLFFVPLMVMWFTQQVSTMLNNIYFSSHDLNILANNFYVYFEKHLFYLIFSIILFVDLFFFTLWYLIEIPSLKNKIKSVEPTFFWWFVVLICYPPFNSFTTNIV